MTAHFNRWWMDHRLAAGVMFVIAALTTVVLIAIDLPGDDTYVRGGSLMELSTELLSLGGLALAIVQLRANWHDDRLRRGWMFATAAMTVLAVSEANDWLSVAGAFWDEDYRYKLPLWIGAAVAFYLCTRLYPARPWVRRALIAGFIVQSLSNLLDMADGDLFMLPFATPEGLDFATELTEFVSLQCYVAALVFTILPLAAIIDSETGIGVRRPRLAFVAAGVAAPRATVPIAVGALARTLYHEQHLFRAARYPTSYPFLHKSGIRQLVTLVMVAMFGARIAPRVSRAGGKPVLSQFRDLVVLGIRQGIDAVSYYLYELYRPQGRAQAPYYLTRYETKNGLLTVLNAMHPRGEGVPYNMTDKLAFEETCAAAHIPTPPILLTVDGDQVSCRAEPGSFDRDLFAKLMRGRGTMRTGRFRRIAPWRYVDRDGREIGIDDIVERLQQQSRPVFGRKTTPFIVQPCLRNHPGLADLAGESLIVIRVVTCLNRDNEPEVTHGLLRILAKIEPHWHPGADGEYGAAIDLDTGRLGRLTGDKPDTCLRWYETHPVTGAPVLGRTVPDWPALCALALRGHRAFPTRIVIGWDLALTDRGPMMIEGNSNMDVSFIQRAYRDPIGHSRLGELLDYHLSALRRR